MEITIDDIINRIDELLEFNRWTLYKLAKEANISYSTLSNIYARRTFPSIPTLYSICKGFNISLSDFFNFKENPLRDYDYEEFEQILINDYRRLSQRNKDILRAYLDALINSSKNQ